MIKRYIALAVFLIVLSGCSQTFVEHNQSENTNNDSSSSMLWNGSSSSVSSTADTVSSLSTPRQVQAWIDYRNSQAGFSFKYPAFGFEISKNKKPDSLSSGFLDYIHLNGDQVSYRLPYANCDKGPDQCEKSTRNISLTFFVLPQSFEAIRGQFKISVDDEFIIKGHRGFSSYSGGEGINFRDRYIDLDTTQTLWVQTLFNADELVGISHTDTPGFLDIKKQEQIDTQIFDSLSFE